MSPKEFINRMIMKLYGLDASALVVNATMSSGENHCMVQYGQTSIIYNNVKKIYYIHHTGHPHKEAATQEDMKKIVDEFAEIIAKENNN